MTCLLFAITSLATRNLSGVLETVIIGKRIVDHTSATPEMDCDAIANIHLGHTLALQNFGEV